MIMLLFLNFYDVLMMHIVKWSFPVFIYAIFQALPSAGVAQHQQDDSLTHKQIKKLKREEFKKTQERYFFKLGAMNARLDTEVSFEILNNFLTAKLGLEDNLGLPGKRTFFTAAFVHRFTPVSGLYTQYYGINRTENYSTEKDIIFQDDTIPAGTSSMAYFNTQVISAGYLLSLKQDPNAFLGAYINIYLMWLDTGVKSDIGSIDAKVRYAAPLPNFGLVAMFKLSKWLDLDANVGFFSLKLNDFDGTLYDFSARLVFKPAKWLGISLSYQEFDIRVSFPYEDINTTVDYNFRGPALGVNLSF